MFKNEEEKLGHYKNELDNIPVSLGSLDNAIMAGFHKAKSEQRKRTRKMRGIYSFVIAALLLIGLFSSIKISPAFASYISEIPGMEKIVKLIDDDKGRMAAVEKKYYQKQGVSDEKDGLKVTIDGTISDEKGIVLFYTLQSKEKIKEIQIDKVNLKAKDGTVLDEASISYGELHQSEKGEHSFSGEIEYFFEAPLTAKNYVINIEVKGKKFSLPFTLNDFKAKKEYTINKTMELEGQKIYVEKADIYPLRVAIHLKMNPNNTKQILNLEDLRLVDENNEVWGKISNGATGLGDKDTEQEIYLQSNYFTDPKELYLVLNSAQAVDKKDLIVIVDTDKLEIQKQPNGEMLQNIRFEEERGLVFELHSNKAFNFELFGDITDANGNKIEVHEQSMSSSDRKGLTELGIKLPPKNTYKNPISIELNYYPSWIKGHEKIRIK
ncbi:DUF4179 domain-containing protein [Fictibacillus barbaricus]|uniref:DUF4179 domain-containing protein n=1 Tax=Fictibacillus barbaricus TaxID=182136 RepID=A0ABU1U4R6_9BACL|nr:DUF4179 domain-containing protein [Fictibacillus barbaricus]MDR7074398.1 hypothetical protein [Fictibacillus barbaricus]